MVALLVVFMIVVFITADVLVRVASHRFRENKARRERAAALDVGLKLDFAEEAKSLKRVVVSDPKATILAVDDEAIVLDSFRKILVLAGYGIDTVETGPEALNLIKQYDYDFVFTDLKMPEMDGLDVTKAVKHLRPDIDVIMITGYATIESAVEAMKYGALDYVQKPFTEDELVAFVNKSWIRRQDRLERGRRPKIHLITATSGETQSEHVFNVPAGLFIAPEHTWVGLEMDGSVRIGLDDLAQKLVGSIDEILLPKSGQKIKKGAPVFTLVQAGRTLPFPSPISGIVRTVNSEIKEHIELLNMKPYELGWLCRVEAADLATDLRGLRIGANAVSWYQKEVDKFMEAVRNISAEERGSREESNGSEQETVADVNGHDWEAFSRSFLQKN